MDNNNAAIETAVEMNAKGLFVPDWPIEEIVRILAEVADHLLHRHDCDHVGHEEYLYAMRAANEWMRVDTLERQKGLEAANQNAAQDGQGQWVAVSDRLPECSVVSNFVTRRENGHIELSLFSTHTGWVAKKGSPITHWMPLPDAPYTEETNATGT